MAKGQPLAWKGQIGGPGISDKDKTGTSSPNHRHNTTTHNTTTQTTSTQTPAQPLIPEVVAVGEQFTPVLQPGRG